ncbi:MAG: hypothetical protein JO360_01635 [Acidobacteria bacterium]|nr:hypothetical protein [Acidobacteriota bacterium]
MLAQSVSAQDDRKPSTPEERAEAVRVAHVLETDPFNKEALGARERVLKWLAQAPDITVDVCTGFVSPLLGNKKNYSSELVAQQILSSAAFIIEHPDKAEEKPAVSLAGLEGILKMYESILKTKPKAKWAYLDDLIEKRDKGELNDYVMGVMKTGCKSE